MRQKLQICNIITFQNVAHSVIIFRETNNYIGRWLMNTNDTSSYNITKHNKCRLVCKYLFLFVFLFQIYMDRIIHNIVSCILYSMDTNILFEILQKKEISHSNCKFNTDVKSNLNNTQIWNSSKILEETKQYPV